MEFNAKFAKPSEKEMKQKRRMEKFQEKFKNFDKKNFRPFGGPKWDQTRLKNFQNGGRAKGSGKGKNGASPSEADLKKINSKGPPNTKGKETAEKSGAAKPKMPKIPPKLQQMRELAKKKKMTEDEKLAFLAVTDK